MEISGYGVAYNYNIYGISANKAKTSSAITENPAEKPKTESKNSNAINNLFKDTAKISSVSSTKTELTRDEELLIAMAELGRKHAQQGIPFRESDEEFFALAKEYIQPSKESLFGTPFSICISTYEEDERYKEIMAAYDAGYHFTTGRYSPLQDADIDPNKEARFLDGRLPSGSFAKSREIYNSIYDRFASIVT
jgi:hypothetical protein